MNEKKHKKKKVIDLKKKSAKEAKKSLGIMEIELFDNGSVQVRDFPDTPAAALQICAAGMIELAMYFIGKAAMEAESRIIKPGQDSIDLVNQSKGKDGLII
jgi:hypothetical protein